MIPASRPARYKSMFGETSLPTCPTEGLMKFLSLRALFLLGFVVAMPVLALPPVARRIDELLYGPPPSELGRAPSAAPLMEELSQLPASGPIAPMRFQEPSPAAPGPPVSHSPAATAPPTPP